MLFRGLPVVVLLVLVVVVVLWCSIECLGIYAGTTRAVNVMGLGSKGEWYSYLALAGNPKPTVKILNPYFHNTLKPTPKPENSKTQNLGP